MAETPQQCAAALFTFAAEEEGEAQEWITTALQATARSRTGFMLNISVAPCLSASVRTTIMDHEQAFVSAFVVPEKRARYAEFLPKPKRRGEITDRFCHLFDFIPDLAKRVPRDSDLAAQLRKRGAGDTAHVIGGRDGFDGSDLPLEEAINEAMIDPSGVVISCIPGRLALYMQEFPPGDTFIMSCKP